ncbi:DEKNAAC101855 [Brettanomyces naardenensis]|uniref:DEKNAAC101855 n=1 Tax=Brettanomyces naardenensis TaxID=13370 RepID=A0A448YJ15_BRENA|nr:DEKNAAC101855 [Brettanomyces naardenensis]
MSLSPDRSSNQQKVRRHKELFDRIDTAHCGEITLVDFEKAMERADHPLKDSAFAMSEIYNAFVNAPNQDHRRGTPQTTGVDHIDFAQFNNYLMMAEDQIAKGFQEVDRDHDGRITKKDLKSYLIRMGVKPTPAEVSVFFNSIDTKGQGYITFDSFRDGLLLIPRMNGSRIRTAFRFFNDDLENISSDGDVTIGSDIRKNVGFFLAGGLSGVVSRTCTAPLDRVKVFLIARTDLNSTLLTKREAIQRMAEEKEHHKVPTKKIQSPLVRAARTIYRQGGLKAFYTGNGLNVFKVFPESAMKFGSFEAAKRFMCTMEGVEDETQLSRAATYISGGIGGVCAQITVYPIDTLKYRLQCASLESDVKGTSLLAQTAKDMYAEGGLRLFYRGLLVGLGGMFPYAAMDLGTFTTLKRWYIRRQAAREGVSVDEVSLPNYLVLTMGATSGTFGASMVYPINLLRTRLQAQGTYAHPYHYSGFFDVARQTVKREGFQGLYKGLLPNLAKVAPAVSISYLMYENLKKLFGLE